MLDYKRAVPKRPGARAADPVGKWIFIVGVCLIGLTVLCALVVAVINMSVSGMAD